MDAAVKKVQHSKDHFHAVSPFLKNLKPVKQFNQISLGSIPKKPIQILEEIEEEKKNHLTIINQEKSMNSTPKKVKNTSIKQTIKS